MEEVLFGKFDKYTPKRRFVCVGTLFIWVDVPPMT